MPSKPNKQAYTLDLCSADHVKSYRIDHPNPISIRIAGSELDGLAVCSGIDLLSQVIHCPICWFCSYCGIAIPGSYMDEQCSYRIIRFTHTTFFIDFCLGLDRSVLWPPCRRKKTFLPDRPTVSVNRTGVAIAFRLQKIRHPLLTRRIFIHHNQSGFTPSL